MALLFAGCSKKESPKPALTPATVTDADIMGKWLQTTDTVYTMKNGQTTSSISAGETQYYIYGANNSEIVSLSSNQTAYFTYYISNGVIKQNDSYYEMDFTIIALSANRMLVRETTGDPNTYTDAVLVKQ